MQVENVEGTQALPYGFMENTKEMFDSILEKVKNKSKEAYDEAKKFAEKWAEELQQKEKIVKDKFNKKLEELQKWYEEKKVSAEEFRKQLGEIAQETKETLYQAYEKARQQFENLLKDLINGKEIERELGEILEKLPKGGETYGFLEDFLDKIKAEKKEFAELVEKVKKIMKQDVEAVIKNLEKCLEEMLKKFGNVDKIKEKLEQLKNEVLKRLNGQQVQQASLTISYGLFKQIEDLIRTSLRSAEEIGRKSLDIPRHMLKGFVL